MHVRGPQHKEPGQQLRLRPAGMLDGLAVLLNPSGPGLSGLPLAEGIFPALQVCSRQRPCYATTRAYRAHCASEALRVGAAVKIEEAAWESYKKVSCR